MNNLKEGKKNAATGKGLTIIRIIPTAILNIFLVICILLLLYSAVTKENGFAIGSYKLVGVLSGSMEPEIGTGSLVVAHSVSKNELMVGDVIVYEPMEERNVLVTHRIISINSNDNSFTTKGDASDNPDRDSVYYGQVVGKVVLSIPFLGHLAGFLKTSFGIVVIDIFILCEIVLWCLSKNKNKNKNEKEEKVEKAE